MDCSMPGLPVTSWQIDGEKIETVTDFIFLDYKITGDYDCSHEIKRFLLLRRKAMTNPESILKSRDITSKKVHSQSYDFSSSHVQMWELDHKEGRALKKWCFRTVVLEKTLESPLDYKEIKPVSPKGNQYWIFIWRTDAKAEAPIPWSPTAKSQLTGKYPDAGKDWGQEEKGVTEDETVGWYHWVDGHEFQQTLGDSGGQGSLACCSPWDCKRFGLDWATELKWILRYSAFFMAQLSQPHVTDGETTALTIRTFVSRVMSL